MRFLFFFFLIGLQCQNTLPSAQLTQKSSILPSISSEWLKKLKTTRRINGGRYADLVVDADGNSYIASFEMKENGNENLLILKADKAGNTLWEIGQEIHGRAYGLTFSPDGNLWIVGTLGQSLIHPSLSLIKEGSRAFLMQLSPNGQILTLNFSKESAVGFNITINVNQEILITGSFDQSISFDDEVLKKDKANNGFAALFDKHGVCKWIVPTTPNINRLGSKNGFFYLTGSFNDSLILGKYALETKDNYDSDVFVARMLIDGTYDWVKQIGSVGNDRIGYRSSESGAYFSIDPNWIEVLGSVEGEVKYSIIDWNSQLRTANKKGVTSLFLMNIGSAGYIIDFKILVKNIHRRSVATMVKDEEGNYYITGVGQDSCVIGGKLFRSPTNHLFFVAKFNKKHELQWVRHNEGKTDAVVRSIQIVGKHIYMTGHYRNQFQIDSLEVTGNSVHELFLMRLKKN